MKRLLPAIARALGFYLFGIVACVILTPVELTLIGRPLWAFFAPFAVLGYVVFYVNLPPQYVFGSGIAYWSVYILGLAGLLGGLAALVVRQGRFRRWAAPLIGLALGFVGTLGVFYSILAGI